MIIVPNLHAQTDDEFADTTTVRHNVLLKLGGAAGFYSIIYAYLNKHELSLRAGVSYLNIGYLGEGVLVPIGIGWHLPLRSNKSMELSGGPTFISSGYVVLHSFLGLTESRSV